MGFTFHMHQVKTEESKSKYTKFIISYIMWLPLTTFSYLDYIAIIACKMDLHFLQNEI